MRHKWRARHGETVYKRGESRGVGGCRGGRSEGELAEEIEALRKQLRQAQQDEEILQEALGFFVGRRKP